MNRLSQYANDDVIKSVQIDGSANPAIRETPGPARWLALGAIAGPILFTLAWSVLGFVSPGFTIFGALVTPYSAISQPISGLGLGPTAPYMNASFVLGGLLILAGSAGVFQSIRGKGRLARWICTVLLGLSGLGMVICGIFTLESFLPHMVGFLLGTGAPVLGFLIAGSLLRSLPYWKRFGSWLLLASPLTLALLVLALATFDPLAAGAGLGVGGLTQRILVVEVHAWYVIMGWLAFHRS